MIQLPLIDLMEKNSSWRPGRPIIWYHKSRTRSNQHCLYCNSYLGPGSAVSVNKEHLIGRRFVPKGSLNEGQRFNFIFGACEACNGLKARYEDHVSVISMIWSPRFEHDPAFYAAALSKAASSYHPLHRGKKVAESTEYPSFESKLLGMHTVMGFVAPPQLSHQHTKPLAAMHVQALYSLATTKNWRSAVELKRLAPSNIWILGVYKASDWGNPVLVEASRRITSCVSVVTVNAAAGAFRASLRRVAGKQHWVWALEWNEAIRIVGAIGDYDIPPDILTDIAPAPWKELSTGRRFRMEIPHTGPDDLFSETPMPDEL